MNTYLASLLLTHFFCNAQAAVVPVSPQDAGHCSRNFETLKFYLHPEISPADAAQMPLRQRAQKSVEAYGFYVAWTKDNPALVARLKETTSTLYAEWHRSAPPRNSSATRLD